MWHDGRQHSPWLQWNLPVDVTSNDPRQSSDTQGKVIPPRDDAGETKEPSHVGRWRQQKEPDEPQTAVEEETVKESKRQEKDKLTAVPRAGAMQEVVPLPQKQSGTYSVQGIEARE